MMKVPVRVVMLLMLCLMGRVRADVVIRPWHKDLIVLQDMEATFGARVPNYGLRGKLHVADPLDACAPLTNGPLNVRGPRSPFLLVENGKCNFVTKVKHAQDAGFAAAIVFNDEDESKLITMEGNATYITIYAVFVTKASGETLLRSADDGRTSCYLIPSANFSHWSTWSIAAVVVTSICVVLLALSIFLCVRRHQLKRRQRALASQPLLG